MSERPQLPPWDSSPAEKLPLSSLTDLEHRSPLHPSGKKREDVGYYRNWVDVMRAIVPRVPAQRLSDAIPLQNALTAARQRGDDCRVYGELLERMSSTATLIQQEVGPGYELSFADLLMLTAGSYIEELRHKGVPVNRLHTQMLGNLTGLCDIYDELVVGQATPDMFGDDGGSPPLVGTLA